MQLHELVNTFGQDLKQRHGQKIHKLSIHGAFTCPNRDGTLGRGGCTFCNVSSFADESAQQLSVVQQLLARRDEVTRAKRYLAYFQAYTSTYAEVEYLQRMYEEALSVSDMVGLCVGTRPDCVPDAVLDLLAGYQARGYEVWLELGLQSANDKTLQRINRGHGYAAYADAVERAEARPVGIEPGKVQVLIFASARRIEPAGHERGTEDVHRHPGSLRACGCCTFGECSDGL